MKKYTYIKTYNNKNSDDDFTLCRSIVVQTNGQYTLSFHLDSDGDGVIDTYHFYDIKTKISGSNGSPWDFDEFTDVNDEWTEHGSLEDFGYDSNKISEALYNMRLEFVKTYLNGKSQDDLLNNAAVSFNKRDILKEDFNSGNLVFEEGNKSIIPTSEG